MSMLHLGHLGLTALCTVVAIPNLVLFAQVSAASLPGGRLAQPHRSSGGRPRLGVVVPAHDEEKGLPSTLTSVAHQLKPGDRLVVVAHNCADRTAAVARGAGAEVVECRDPGRVGKGYALHAGYEYLAATGAPDLFVVVDADCELASSALEELAFASGRSGTAVQATYLMTPPGAGDSRLRLSAFAWLVKNHVRPLGWRRAGFGCQLAGTGMAIPFEALRSVDLATGHIVEDVVIGVELALAGYPPVYCPESMVVSTMAATGSGRAKQRMRWIHGHLLVCVRSAARLLAAGGRRGDRRLLGMGLDFLVPPLSLLLGADAVALASAFGWLTVSGMAGPAVIASTASILFVLAMAIAWGIFGRSVVAVTDFRTLPAHVIAVLDILAQYVRGRRSTWSRSERS